MMTREACDEEVAPAALLVLYYLVVPAVTVDDSRRFAPAVLLLRLLHLLRLFLLLVLHLLLLLTQQLLHLYLLRPLRPRLDGVDTFTYSLRFHPNYAEGFLLLLLLLVLQTRWPRPV